MPEGKSLPKWRNRIEIVDQSSVEKNAHDIKYSCTIMHNEVVGSRKCFVLQKNRLETFFVIQKFGQFSPH